MPGQVETDWNHPSVAQLLLLQPSPLTFHRASCYTVTRTWPAGRQATGNRRGALCVLLLHPTGHCMRGHSLDTGSCYGVLRLKAAP